MVVGMQHQQQQPHASPATVLEDATTPCAGSPLNTPSSVNGDTSDSSESGSATSVTVSAPVASTLAMSTLANAMYSNNRVKLREVNPHLVCVLCHGYFVDATSIAECLHSFCRSCIILYLGTKNYCPICEVQINNSKPHLSLKPDKTLQDIVYKLVPGLFHAEMKRRNQFYQDHPNRDLHLHPEFRGITVDRLVYSPQDSICLSLEYYDKSKEKEEWEVVGSHRVSFIPSKRSTNKIDLDDDDIMPKKYFVCPAAVRVTYLKKLIRLKYNLEPDHKVELFYRRESLPDDYSLMDIAYIYAWKRNSPMRLYYRINILSTVTESMDKLMLNSAVDENSSQMSPVTVALGDDKFAQHDNETVKRSPTDVRTPSPSAELVTKTFDDDVKPEQTCAKADVPVSLSSNTAPLENDRLSVTVNATSKVTTTPANTLLTVAKTKATNSVTKSTAKLKGAQEKKETSKSKAKTSVPNLKPIGAEKSQTPIRSYLSISSILSDIDKPEAKKAVVKPRKAEELRKSSVGEDKQAQTCSTTVAEAPATTRSQTPTSTTRVSSPVPLKSITTSIADATVSKSITSSVCSKTVTVPTVTQPIVTSVASKTEAATIAVSVANPSKTIAASTTTLTTATASVTKTSTVDDLVPSTVSAPARVPTPTSFKASTSVTNAVKTAPSVTLANTKMQVSGTKTVPSTSSTVVSVSKTVPSVSTTPVSASRTVASTTSALSGSKTVVSTSTVTVSASKSIASTSTSAVSAHKSIASTSTAIVSVNKTIASTSTATVSVNKTIASTSTATVSVNKTISSTSIATVSVDKTIASTSAATVSANNAIASTFAAAGLAGKSITSTSTSVSAPNKTVPSTSTVSSLAKSLSIPSSTSITVSTKSFTIPSSLPPLITLTSTPTTASSTFVTASKDFSNSQYILSNTKIPSSLEISLTSSKEPIKSSPVISLQKMVHGQSFTNGSPVANGNAKLFGAKKAEERLPLKRTMTEEKKGDEKKICLQNSEISVSTNGTATKKIFSPNILPEVSITLNPHPEQNKRITPETSYDVSCFKPKEANGVPPLTPINAPICKNIQNSPIKNLNKKLNTNVKVVRNSNVNVLAKSRPKLPDKIGEPEAKKPCLENGVLNGATSSEIKEKTEETPKPNEIKTPPKKEARHQGIPKLIDINTAPYSKLMAQNAKARLQYLHSLYIKPPPPESNSENALDLSSPSSKSPASDKSDPSPDKKKIIPSVPPLMIPVTMSKDTKSITKSPNSLPKIERKPSPIAKMEKSSPRKPEFRLDNGSPSPKTSKSPQDKSPATPISKYSPIFPKTPSPIGTMRYSPPEFLSNAANLNFIRQQRDLQRFFTPQLNGFNREAAATVKMYEDWIMKAYQCGALPSHPLMHPAVAKPPNSQESPTFRFKK